MLTTDSQINRVGEPHFNISSDPVLGAWDGGYGIENTPSSKKIGNINFKD